MAPKQQTTSHAEWLDLKKQVTALQHAHNTKGFNFNKQAHDSFIASLKQVENAKQIKVILSKTYKSQSAKAQALADKATGLGYQFLTSKKLQPSPGAGDAASATGGNSHKKTSFPLDSAKYFFHTFTTTTFATVYSLAIKNESV